MSATANSSNITINYQNRNKRNDIGKYVQWCSVSSLADSPEPKLENDGQQSLRL